MKNSQRSSMLVGQSAVGWTAACISRRLGVEWRKRFHVWKLDSNMVNSKVGMSNL